MSADHAILHAKVVHEKITGYSNCDYLRSNNQASSNGTSDCNHSNLASFQSSMQGIMHDILRVLGILSSDVNVLLIRLWLGTVVVLSLRRAVGRALVGVEGRHAGQVVASTRYTLGDRKERMRERKRGEVNSLTCTESGF